MLPKKKARLLKLCIIIIFIIAIMNGIINFKNNNKGVSKLLKKSSEILWNENYSGNTYYISSNGSSSNGMDINDPMSLEIANQKLFKER